MEQLSIFSAYLAGRDPPRARRDDPATSQLAAAQASGLALAHEAKIVEALSQGDATIHELAERTGLTHVQVARRMKRLAEANGTVFSYADKTRMSPSGRPCRVWGKF
jgi:transcriptional regulator with GAF, ATPase, and Fis domain